MFKRSFLNLGRTARFANTSTRNVSSFVRAHTGSRHQALKLGLTFGSALAAGTYLSVHFGGKTIQLDSSKAKSEKDLTKSVKVTNSEGIELIQPPTSSPPFPVELSVGTQKFDLLGVGVRYVSIFSFHVYALGIYIASEDRALARSVLAGAADLTPEHDLKSALLDPEQGTKIITHLLDHGVRLDFRIVPVRNTDFGHWRDAFVRQILAHPLFKQLNSLPDEEGREVANKLGEGVNDLKVAFSRKITVPKGHILHMIRESSGALRLVYYKANDENAKDLETIELGTIQNPNVSKILALQYLAGKYVSSESTRLNVVDGLANL